MLNAQGSIAESQTVQLYVQVAYKLLCWNLVYADAYAEMLWKENTVSWLKSSSSEQGSLNGVKNSSIVL
jgi:hypothetical protein